MVEGGEISEDQRMSGKAQGVSGKMFSDFGQYPKRDFKKGWGELDFSKLGCRKVGRPHGRGTKVLYGRNSTDSCIRKTYGQA